MQHYDALRREMVEHHVRGRGISDLLVLEAMGKVPREAFVAGHLKESAYADCPLPIGEGQTISQPYIVAYMIEAMELKGGEKVLEIGAGSGYAAAVMAEIAGEVFAIERIGPLAEQAASNLAAAGYRDVRVKQADGTLGWHEEAPFDAILVSAGAPSVPEALKTQLAEGGRLVLPVGAARTIQKLVRITRRDRTRFETTDLTDVQFVPLIGDEGWQGDTDPEPW
jgi:protein-L-isoaspartate(D-aspartate) O-methyltransferase